MPFNTGLSGVNAAHADLKTTANNIANTSTIGYKASRAEFANVYAISRTGSSETAIGAGARLTSVSQQFTQGNISFTENNLDLAINGDGFFNVEDKAGALLYSRNGEFKIDREGYIVSAEGFKLQGYQPVSNPVPNPTPPDANIDTANIDAMQITTGSISPRATSDASVVANLDSQEPAITVSPAADRPIDPDDPATFNHTTSFRTYDSLGNPMSTSLYFKKTDVVSNTWVVGARTVDAAGNAIPADTAGTPNLKNTQDFFVTFDTSGAVATIDHGPATATAAAPPPTGSTSPGTAGTGDLYNNTVIPATGTVEIQLDLTGDGVLPGAGAADDTIYNPAGGAAQTITMALSGLTQYGSDFAVNDIVQNGYSSGELSGIDVDQSGIVSARFTNGQSKELGQIILSGFANPQGLGQEGNNSWSATYAAGEAVINTPGSGGLGLIQSGALEEANVNLTEELISLITAQRNFQANAKTITTANTISQTLINM